MSDTITIDIGREIILKQKQGSNTNVFYPRTLLNYVFNDDGVNLAELLKNKANSDHGNHVPSVEETANNLRFLRNDNTWAEIQKASTEQAGVVKLTDSATTTDSTLAASATAVKEAYDKANHEHPYVKTSSVGSANGVASLDENGFVPSSQLPSYVDDIIDCSTISETEAVNSETGKAVTPESGKIYIVVDDAQENVGCIYRWSGTRYVSIPQGLAIGTTAGTAFPGDKGQTAYEHSQADHALVSATEVEASDQNGYIKIKKKGGEFTETLVYTHPTVDGASSTNPHGTTKTDVGLSNVENKSASDILGELSTENIKEALGYTPANATTLASPTTDGMMSKGYAAKLEGCMEIAISETDPGKDCLWFHIQSSATPNQDV